MKFFNRRFIISALPIAVYCDASMLYFYEGRGGSSIILVG